MKLKFTPAQVSILTLGALGALVAQQLVRSDATPGTSSSNPSDSKSKRAKQPNPGLKTMGLTPSMQPEQMAVSKTGINPEMSKSPIVSATTPTLASPTSPNLVPPAPQLKIPAAKPPEIKVASAQINPVDVNQLPIDAIVSETLKTAPSRKTPLPAFPVKPETDDAIEFETPSDSISALKDVQGHRAQNSINDLQQKGIVQGFGDKTFRPDAPIDDAQFNSMVKKAAAESPSLANLQRPRDIVTRADAAIYVHRQLARTASSGNNEQATSDLYALSKLASNPNPAAPANSYTNPAGQTPNSSAPLPEGTTPVPSTLTLPNRATPAPTAIPVQNNSNPAPTAPDAISAGADLDSYTLGAGDKIRVDVFNVPEYSKDYQVLVNGSLNLHRAGGLRVAGMTLREAERAIATRYRRLLKQPLVDINLIAARPLNVAIAGEVGRPGTYAMKLDEGGKFPTVTKLIQDAGGMNRSANPRQVIVRRAQRSGAAQEVRVDLWALFQTGNSRQDLTLRDGDTVFIPPADSISLAESAQIASANFSTAMNQPINVAIVGEVARPGAYIMGGNNNNNNNNGAPGTNNNNNRGPSGSGTLPTLTQAIQQAGGIKQLANLKEVKVVRATRGGNTQTIKVDLWQLLRTGDLNQDVVLQQGDRIEVPLATALNPEDAQKLGSASFAPIARVNVVGEVKNPGPIEVRMNTPLNQALLAAGGFTREAKKRKVELIRLNENGSVTRRDVSIDLARGVDEKGNPLLRDGDVIVVDRSGGAKVRDTIGNILSPIGSFLPFRGLFGF
jgi:polysaccharide biosynthesis/export protein